MVDENENTFAYELNFGGNAEKILALIADKLVAIEGTLQGAQKNTNKLSDELKDVDDKPLDDAAKAAAELAKKQEAAARATDILKARQAALKDSFDDVKNTGTRFGHVLLGVGAAATGAVFGMYKLMNSQTELGDQQAKTARNLGMSLSAYSEIAYVSDMAGVPAEKLKGVLSALSLNAVASKDTFEKLGLSVYDLNGNMKPTNELFLEVGEKLRQMPDRAKASGLAMQLMGSEGAAAISIFGDSADEFDNVAKRGKALGLILSDEFGEQSEKYQDALSNMKSSLGAFSRSLTIAIAPQATEFFETLADKFSALSGTAEGEHLAESLGQIADKIMEITLRLIDNAPMILKLIGNLTTLSGVLLDVTGFFAESESAVKLFGIAIGGIFGAMAITRALKFASAIGTMASAFYDVKAAAEAAAVAEGLAGSGGKAAIGNTVGSIAGKAGIYGALIAVGASAWTSAISDFIDFMKQKASADDEANHNIGKMTDQNEISDLKVALRKEKDPSKKLNLQLELNRKQSAFASKYSKELFPGQDSPTPEEDAAAKSKGDTNISNYNNFISQTNNIESSISDIGKLIDQNLEKIMLTQLRYSEIGSRVTQMGGA